MIAITEPRLYTVDGATLRLHPHAGQVKALDSNARFVVVLAGTQGGKTSFGPWWLYQEIKRRGPGDYLIVTPTYPLLNLKALPELQRIFEELLQLGAYAKADRVFRFDALGEIRTWGSEQDTPTRILFGHAQDPESLESATAKAAWLDEAGQNKFKLASFEAVMRRLSLAQGRVLITTTPYNLGWLKQKFWDKRHDNDINVIRFDSTENPAFPPEEMDRAKRDLPRWKFDMFYRAIFTRPAGMIYDCFNDKHHVVKPFNIPLGWRTYYGLDFGGVHTACVFIAAEPSTRKLYLYRDYLSGNKLAQQHVADILRNEMRPHRVFGGAKSEQQWRDEFGAASLPVDEPPVSDIEVGINRVYGAIKRDELFVFNTCEGLLDEIASYSRELDDMGEPTEKIADKADYHRLDALRYIMTYLRDDGDFVSMQEY